MARMPLLAADMIQELLWAFTKSSTTEFSMLLKYSGRIGKPRWLALQNLLRNDWFNRIWVIQEVALASSVRVFYSKSEIPWQHLIDIMSSCCTHQSLAFLIGTTSNIAMRKMPPTGIVNAQIMADFRRKIMESESRSMPFSNVLYSCLQFKATNPRDINTGIQDLCKVESGSLISPDYDNRSEAKVFIDAAVCLLGQETPLRLLSYAGIGNFTEPSKIQNLPSWCPEWSRKPLFARLGYCNPKTDYRAWEDSTTAPTFLDSETSPSLMLQGRVIDTIKSVGPIFFQPRPDTTDNFPVEIFTPLRKSTRDSHPLLMQTSPWRDRPYPYTNPPQPLHEVFCRTLIGDRTETTRPAPAPCADSYTRWLTAQDEILAGAEFWRLVPGCAVGRRVCVTRRGYIGFVPAGAEGGDEVRLLRGAQVPFVVRRRAGVEAVMGAKACILVGEAYVHGVMDGQLFGGDEREVRIEDFQIF